MSELKDELNTRFGRAVRQLRESHGWSQEQLAENADLNRSYLGEVERGYKTPSLTTADKLAAALQVSLSSLVARCEGGLSPESLTH